MKLIYYFFFLLIYSIVNIGSAPALSNELSRSISGLESSGPWLIAKNATKAASENNELNAYDPFADYSEFENTAEEQENINFFQNGRFLTLGAIGGVQLFTMNMAALYQTGPAFGGYLNYFFDLNFAIQFALTISSHHVVLQQSGQNFIGSADFTSMGVDFKYFLDKNLFNKHFYWFQPYFFLGTLYSSMTMYATLTNQAGHTEDSGFGLNMGLGLEFQFLKKIHFGIEYAFKFVTMREEAIPLSLNTGNSLINTDTRPYGDWMNITVLLGVNF